MKRSLRLFSIFALSTLLAGCGSNVLSCDGSDTTDTVAKIVRKLHPPETILSVGDYFDKKYAPNMNAANLQAQQATAKCNQSEQAEWVNYFQTTYSSVPQSSDGSACDAQFDDVKTDTSHCGEERSDCITAAGRAGSNDPNPPWCMSADEACEQKAYQAQRDRYACTQKFDSLESEKNNCVANVQAEAFGRVQKMIQDATQAAFDAASYTLDAIRILHKDEQTGAMSCAADVNASLPNNLDSVTLAITYKVERTTDNQLYVTVQDAN